MIDLHSGVQGERLRTSVPGTPLYAREGTARERIVGSGLVREGRALFLALER